MWAREQAVDPVGSAPHARGFLLLEWPLPWPEDIGDIEALHDLSRLCRVHGIRLQAVLAATSTTTRSPVASLYWARDVEWFAGYDRFDTAAPHEALPAAAGALVVEAVAGRLRPTQDGVVDVLVCTHGRRDVCCGGRGTALAVDLAASGSFAASTRLWRTSHLGGHRFAPTALVLPQGTAWAFLDVDAVDRIVHRTGDPRALLDRYRGSAALTTAPNQVLEREAFADIGWGWLDAPRRLRVTNDSHLLLEWRGPSTLLWEASAVEHPSEFPVCGAPNEMKATTTVELVDVTSRVGRV